MFVCYGFTPNLYIEESYSGAGTGVGGKGRDEAKRAGQGARAGRGKGLGCENHDFPPLCLGKRRKI